jgi:hypothetical protein
MKKYLPVFTGLNSSSFPITHPVLKKFSAVLFNIIQKSSSFSFVKGWAILLLGWFFCLLR